MQWQAMLGSSQAQRRYASRNQMQVVAALAGRGLSVVVQKVARSPDGARLSLSCDTDLTLDLVDLFDARGLRRPVLGAEVELPGGALGAAGEDAAAQADLREPGREAHGLDASEEGRT